MAFFFTATSYVSTRVQAAEPATSAAASAKRANRFITGTSIGSMVRVVLESIRALAAPPLPAGGPGPGRRPGGIAAGRGTCGKSWNTGGAAGS